MKPSKGHVECVDMTKSQCIGSVTKKLRYAEPCGTLHRVNLLKTLHV